LSHCYAPPCSVLEGEGASVAGRGNWAKKPSYFTQRVISVDIPPQSRALIPKIASMNLRSVFMRWSPKLDRVVWIGKCETFLPPRVLDVNSRKTAITVLHLTSAIASHCGSEQWEVFDASGRATRSTSGTLRPSAASEDQGCGRRRSPVDERRDRLPARKIVRV
jgi:hypothetical protein